MENATLTLWHLLTGALRFDFQVFQQVGTDSFQGLVLTLLVVLFAGLSLAIGQSIILFINRVRPVRFIFSLLLNAILFTIGYVFQVLSTWFISLLPWSTHLSFLALLKVLGLSYVPLLFSFSGALPYWGFPALRLLSVWNLLLMVTGFAAVTEVGVEAAFGYVAFGWCIKEVIENTIGAPIARLGRIIAERVAGVDLADNNQELMQIIQSGMRQAASPMSIAPPLSSSQLDQKPLDPKPSDPSGEQSTVHPIEPSPGSSTDSSSDRKLQPSISPSAADQPATRTPIKVSSSQAGWLVWMSRWIRRIPQESGVIFALLGMGVLLLAVAIVLRPLKNSVFGWYETLPGLLRLLFNFAWIGMVATVFAGLLAPLETMGWWAGWYGDVVNTAAIGGAAANATPLDQNLGRSLERSAEQFSALDISRYIIYLDGVGQSGEEYTPDVEEFLTALQPVIPQDMALIRGLMMYSVLNRPLDQDRPLAFLWRLADRMRWTNPAALLGILLNIRNIFIVAVSADKRYGPIYNQGIAQVLYSGLRQRGYEPDSGIPITLIGFSGGAEMSVAAAPYLKQAIRAPIDVISLGGVMSANHNFLKLEHLFHLVGDKDLVERIGAIAFPGRWRVFPLSYWNRAKRKGKISILSLGPVGHQVPGGIMDPKALLPDGRSHLQQTIDTILQILQDKPLETENPLPPRQQSNYALYQASEFNRPTHYPIAQDIDLQWYRPIGEWMGRLILPREDERHKVRGVYFEVYHAAVGQEHLVGQVVYLRWMNEPMVKKQVHAIRRDVHFSADAEYSSEYGGLVHPDRLNHWRQVGPLESLAGARPHDDVVVMLEGRVQVEPGEPTILQIRQQPVQISGRYYSLIRFIAPIPHSDRFQVVHFNPASRQFDGLSEAVRLPPVIFAKAYGSYPSTTQAIEQSPLNETGWYIYGAKDASGLFIVQAYAPRSLLRLQPDRVIFGQQAAYRYIRHEAWANPVAQKGHISSVLCTCHDEDIPDAVQTAIEDWREGDRALVLHTYGGIGGNKKEPAAATPLFFGHFAYGLARVIQEPLADELRFDIQYYQVYTHNTDGIIAGTLHWSRFMGDRQFGWAGTRPTCDILIRHQAFTQQFEFNGVKRSALNLMVRHLQSMTARYRIGDGSGGTYVGLANNCAQDSNRALFASIRSLEKAIATDFPDSLEWLTQASAPADRFRLLLQLERSLKRQLQAFGTPRSDWEDNEFNLGSTLEDEPLRNLQAGLSSWRSLLPRKASDTVAAIFLKYGASAWVLRTNQIGGYDPDIEPIAPMTL